MTRQTRNSDPAAPTVVQDAILLDPLDRSAKDALSKLSTKGSHQAWRGRKPLGVVVRKAVYAKEVEKTDGSTKGPVNKTYEGFLTNGTVATHLWCPFRVKCYFHFLQLF